MVPSRSAARLRRISGALLALMLSAVGAAPAGAIGAGAPFGINLVRLVGVLGADRAPGHIMQTTLLVGKREVPFSVVSAERLSGSPEDGVGVLLGMGPGQPRIQVVGENAFLRPLENAPAGTPVTIVGNLIVGMRYLELMGVDLPPSPVAQEDRQDDDL